MSQGKPSGRLTTIAAGESGLDQIELAIAMARAAARNGKNVLLVDCAQHDLTHYLDLTIKTTLYDVLTQDAPVSDAKHIVPNCSIAGTSKSGTSKSGTSKSGTSILVASAGEMPLDRLLGPLAALSMGHEWVFAIVPSGCTPAHVRLMGASDHNVLMFDSHADRFMRAYWMLDAIRSRSPHCDPLMVGRGSQSEVHETYALFASTVHNFLGAPPSLAGIQTPNTSFDSLALHVLSAITAPHLNAGAA